MIAYWSLFFLSLLPEQRNKFAQRVFWTLVSLILVLAVGFRLEVGCDWHAYHLLYFLAQTDLTHAIYITDPGYGFINWLTWQLGGSFYFVNVLGSGEGHSGEGESCPIRLGKSSLCLARKMTIKTLITRTAQRKISGCLITS